MAENLFRTADNYYYIQDNPDLALQQLQQALMLNPNHYKARLLLATIYKDLSNYENAIRELKEAYKQDENEARYELITVMLKQGEILEERGELDAAEKIYSEILSDIYEYEDTARERKSLVLLRIGDKYRSNGDLVSAYKAYIASGIERKADEFIGELLSKAEQLMAHSELQEAESLFTLLMVMQPDNPEWNKRHVKVRKELEVEQKVRELLEEARRSFENKSYQDALNNVNQILSVQETNLDAIEFQKILSLQLKLGQLIAHASQEYNAKNFDAALELLQSASAIQPLNQDIHDLQSQIQLEKETRKILDKARLAYESEGYSEAKELLSVYSVFNLPIKMRKYFFNRY